MYCHPEDVRAVWQELREEVEVERALGKSDRGMLEFTIRDCNGYRLTFGRRA